MIWFTAKITCPAVFRFLAINQIYCNCTGVKQTKKSSLANIDQIGSITLKQPRKTPTCTSYTMFHNELLLERTMKRVVLSVSQSGCYAWTIIDIPKKVGFDINGDTFVTAKTKQTSFQLLKKYNEQVGKSPLSMSKKCIEIANIKNEKRSQFSRIKPNPGVKELEYVKAKVRAIF